MLEHFLVLTSRLMFDFHRQHKAICFSTAIVVLLPFGFVWINIPSRCPVRFFGSVAFPVQGDKPGSSPWEVADCLLGCGRSKLGGCLPV